MRSVEIWHVVPEVCHHHPLTYADTKFLSSWSSNSDSKIIINRVDIKHNLASLAEHVQTKTFRSQLQLYIPLHSVGDEGACLSPPNVDPEK